MSASRQTHTPKSRRIAASPKKTKLGGVLDLTHLINRAVAQFSASIVHGEVPKDRRDRLIRIIPDPIPEVASKDPRLEEMMKCAPGFVFVGLDFSATEQRILVKIYRKMGFSPFNALLEILNRIPQAERQIEETVKRGVPRNDLIAALVVAPEELQAALSVHLPRTRKELGKAIGRIKNYPTLGRKLRFDQEALKSIESACDDRLPALRAMQMVIEKFLTATRDLNHPTKSRLVRLPKIRVTQVLLDSGIATTEAFKVAADLLHAWHPKRFLGLTNTQVRLAYQRGIPGEHRSADKSASD